jgi:hypothetical protein
MSYLNFDLIGHSQSGLTKIWIIRNTWRKYDFETHNKGDRFDHHCLREIADFCETITKDHRAS